MEPTFFYPTDTTDLKPSDSEGSMSSRIGRGGPGLETQCSDYYFANTALPTCTESMTILREKTDFEPVHHLLADNPGDQALPWCAVLSSFITEIAAS